MVSITLWATWLCLLWFLPLEGNIVQIKSSLPCDCGPHSPVPKLSNGHWLWSSLPCLPILKLSLPCDCGPPSLPCSPLSNFVAGCGPPSCPPILKLSLPCDWEPQSVLSHMVETIWGAPSQPQIVASMRVVAPSLVPHSQIVTAMWMWSFPSSSSHSQRSFLQYFIVTH